MEEKQKRLHVARTRYISLVSVFTAMAVAMAYTHGAVSAYLPNVEFMSIIVFVSGFCFGWHVGAVVGVLSNIIWNLFPYPWVSPAATITYISPMLLAVTATLTGLYGLVGGLRGKGSVPPKISLRRFSLEAGLWGFILTFIYDILGSVGFYLAYPGLYPDVWMAIYFTFIPIPGWMPYPPIVHTFANTVIFAVVAPPLIMAARRLQK